MALVSLYNFEDDNILYAFAITISRLVKILESESEVVIDWFKKNKMVVNRVKFQAIILDKQKSDLLMNVLPLIIRKLMLCDL